MAGVKYRYFDAQGYGNGITSASTKDEAVWAAPPEALLELIVALVVCKKAAAVSAGSPLTVAVTQIELGLT